MSLVNDIQRGMYDMQLDSLTTAIADRRKALEEAKKVSRRTQKASDFSVGDRVVVNSICATKYLWGVKGTVVAKKQVNIVVVFDHAIKRFPEGARVTMSPKIVDKA